MATKKKKTRKQTIVINVEGGIPDIVSRLPKNIRIEIRDFDVEGTCPDDNHPLHTTTDGKEYYRQIFEG